MTTRTLSGFISLYKPVGMTSAQCVAKIRKITGIKKVGHAGTLDPFADGVLLIAVGKQATKQIPLLMDLPKQYRAIGQLDILTDTLDVTGKIISPTCHTNKPPDYEQVIKTPQLFGEQYDQIPPAYSALKHQGLPLYQIARQQKMSLENLSAILTRKKRTVTFSYFEITDYTYPFFTVNCTVSKGTYIRVLVDDIAQKIGRTATTIQLTRTAIGTYLLKEAVTLEDLAQSQHTDTITKYITTICL